MSHSLLLRGAGIFLNTNAAPMSHSPLHHCDPRTAAQRCGHFPKHRHRTDVPLTAAPLRPSHRRSEAQAFSSSMPLHGCTSHCSPTATLAAAPRAEEGRVNAPHPCRPHHCNPHRCSSCSEARANFSSPPPTAGCPGPCTGPEPGAAPSSLALKMGPSSASVLSSSSCCAPVQHTRPRAQDSG